MMLKVLCWSVALGSLIAAGPAPAQAADHPADPTRGGNGGRIVRVTTLAKDGPGSFQAAVATKGPRIVVFEVGGVIDLGRETLTIAEPFLTIAGQTAPSPGITIIKGGIDIKAHDVVVSHLRVMTGVDGQAKLSGWEADAFSTVAAHNVVVEHCSFLWALDENMSASGPRFGGKNVAEWRANTSHDVIFRENIAAEGIANASHPKGEHSKGSLIHDNTTGMVYFRNVFAHNVERSPLVKGGAQALMINNLIYNPGHRAVHYNLMNLEWLGHDYVTGEITAVGNVMRGGNDTDPGLPFLMLGGDGDLAYYGRDNRAVAMAKPRPAWSPRQSRWPAWQGTQCCPRPRSRPACCKASVPARGTARPTISACCSSSPKVAATSSTMRAKWVVTPNPPRPAPRSWRATGIWRR